MVVFFQTMVVILLCSINIYAAELSTDNQFSVSDKFGFISETFIRSNSDKPIIIIQDLHKDKITQTNIQNIVAEIDKNYGFKHIFIEGLYNKPVWNNDNNSLETAKLLFDNSYLSGAEYYALSNNMLEKIIPLDEEQIYRNNIQRLAYLILMENDINKYLSTNNSTINSAKNKAYSLNNKKIDKLIQNYRAGKISQKKFYLSINKYANKKELDEFPNISNYYKVIKNNNINFKKLNSEVKSVINDLKDSIPYAEYSAIVSNKELLISDIEKFCIRYDVNLDTYKELQKYVSLQKTAKLIDNFKFIDEEREFIRNLKIKYSKNKNERLLIILDDLYSYYKDFLTNKLTEYGYNYLNDFGIDNFMNLWVNILSTKDIYALKELNRYFNEYNQANIYRSEIFIDKISELKQHTDANIVAVMGGFHTRRVSEYLKYQNISYVVITPTLNYEGIEGKKYRNTETTTYKRHILRSLDLQHNAIPAPSPLNSKEEQERDVLYCSDTNENIIGETSYDRNAIGQGIMAYQWMNSLKIQGDGNLKSTSLPGLIATSEVNRNLKQKLKRYIRMVNNRHGNIIQVSDEDSLHLTIYNPTATKLQTVSDIADVFKNKEFVKKIVNALSLNESDIENNKTALTDNDRELIYDIIEQEMMSVLNDLYRKGFRYPQWEIDGLAAFPNGTDTPKTILVFHARPKTEEDFKVLSELQQALYDKLGFKDYPVFNGHITLGRFVANDFPSEEEQKDFLDTIREINVDIKNNLTKSKYTLYIHPVISRLHLNDSKPKIIRCDLINIFTNTLRNDLMKFLDKITIMLGRESNGFLSKTDRIDNIALQTNIDALNKIPSKIGDNNAENKSTTENVDIEEALRLAKEIKRSIIDMEKLDLINEINEQARQSLNYIETLEELVSKKNKELSLSQQNFGLRIFKTNNTVKIIVGNTKYSDRQNISKVFTFSGEEFKEQTLEEKLNIYDNMSREKFLDKFKISEQEYEELKDIIKSKDSIKAIELLQTTTNINIAYYIFFHFYNNMKFVEEVINNENIDIKIRLYAYIIAKINGINISEIIAENLSENASFLIKNEMIVGQNGQNVRQFNFFLENELFRNEIFVSYHAAIILYLQSVFPEKQISKETFQKLLMARIDKNYNGSGDSSLTYGEEHIWNHKRFANISAHEIGHNFLYDLDIDTNRTENKNRSLRKFVQVIHEFYAQNTAHIFMNGNGFGNGQIVIQCGSHFHGLTKQYESATRADGNYQYNFNNRSPHLGGYSLLYMLNYLLDLSDNNNAIYLSKAIENITPQFINKVQTVDKYTVYDYVIELLEEYGKIAGYDVSNTIKYLQNNRPITNYDDVWLFPKLNQIPQQYYPVPLNLNFAQSYQEAKRESLYPAFDEIGNIKHDTPNINTYINLLAAN